MQLAPWFPFVCKRMFSDLWPGCLKLYLAPCHLLRWKKKYFCAVIELFLQRLAWSVPVNRKILCCLWDMLVFLDFYCSMACVWWYPEVRCFCVAMSVVAFMVFLWEDLVFGFLARPWPYHCTSRLAALSTWWRQVLLQQWWERWLPNPFT